MLSGKWREGRREGDLPLLVVHLGEDGEAAVARSGERVGGHLLGVHPPLPNATAHRQHHDAGR
eukprot:3706253-Rhodomonas_salina.3